MTWRGVAGPQGLRWRGVHRMVTAWVRSAAVVVMALAALQPARAVGTASLSPSGKVAQVLQVVVRFDQSVLPVGDLQQPDPVAVACQGDPAGATPPGSGHWADDRMKSFAMSHRMDTVNPIRKLNQFVTASGLHD